MKNYIVILISTIVLSKMGVSQGQKDSIPSASKDAMAKVMPSIYEDVKKNELSIDLIPLIKASSALQGIFGLKGTIQYKRQLKSHLFLRFGVTGIQEQVEREFTNIQVHPSGSYYDAVTYTGTRYKPQLHLNTGLEYRWGKGRIKQFAGVDLGYVHKERVYSDYVAFVPKYSNYDPNNYSAGQYNHTDSLALFNNNDTHVSRSFAQKRNGISITPFYGVQYLFSKRFFFSMQLGIPMQILWIRNKEITGTNFFYRNGNIVEFDLGEGGVLNNVSLGFRF
jgi:hypothetical protein